MSLFEQLIPFQNQRANRRNGADEGEQFSTPAYQVKESVDAYGLEVFVPGVGRDAVEIQVDADQLVVTARRRWASPKEWTPIFRETTDANYQLRLNLNEVVNVEKINAELEHGVLRVTLPKAEALKPRKIDIN